MFDIYLRESGNPHGFGKKEFAQEFQKICRSHREAGRALAFAFILFDYDHPEVRKVLYDQMYWDALDKISGRFLTVFSFNLQSEENLRSKSRERGRYPRNAPVLEGVNGFLEKHFGMKFPQSRPLILFFQVDADQILPPYVYELKAESVESAFGEIRDALSTAVQSAELIQPEFRGNTKEIFEQIKQSLSQRKLLQKAKVVSDIVLRAKDLFGK